MMFFEICHYLAKLIIGFLQGFVHILAESRNSRNSDKLFATWDFFLFPVPSIGSFSLSRISEYLYSSSAPSTPKHMKTLFYQPCEDIVLQITTHLHQWKTYNLPFYRPIDRTYQEKVLERWCLSHSCSISSR